MAEFIHTVPSGSRIVIVVSTGPLSDELTTKIEADNIRMPDVLGKSQGVALEELADGGFKPRVIYDYNDDIVKGAVMDQHPPAGALACTELESLLLVSSGPSINERVQVNLPHVIGMDENEAANRLKDAGLSPQIVHYKSSSVEKGKVSAQIPDYASLVAQPEVKSKVAWIIIAIITLALLALGYFVYERMNITLPPPVEQVVSQVMVPNLIGLTESDAQLELQKAGLTLGNVTTASAEDTPVGAAPGTVFESIPTQGDEIAAGSPVALVLAGEAPGEAADMTLVPEVLGLEEDEVLRLFEEADLRTNLVRAPDLEVEAGLVVLQSPLPDAEVAVGSIVVVVISAGAPEEVSTFELVDVIGKSVSEATEILQTAGLVVTMPLGDEAAAGTVSGQVPEAGVSVLSGSVVILQIETLAY